jgi:hypothetical protein
VRIEAPAKVSLFAYDNQTLIVESFRDEPSEITVLTAAEYSHLKNLQTGETLSGTMRPPHQGRSSAQAPTSREQTSFKMILPPHSYVAFQETR